MDQVIFNANRQLEELADQLTTTKRELMELTEKHHDLTESIKEKNKTQQKTQELYERLKRKVNLPNILNAATNSVEEAVIESSQRRISSAYDDFSKTSMAHEERRPLSAPVHQISHQAPSYSFQTQNKNAIRMQQSREQVSKSARITHQALPQSHLGIELVHRNQRSGRSSQSNSSDGRGIPSSSMGPPRTFPTHNKQAHQALTLSTATPSTHRQALPVRTPSVRPLSRPSHFLPPSFPELTIAEHPRPSTVRSVQRTTSHNNKHHSATENFQQNEKQKPYRDYRHDKSSRKRAASGSFINRDDYC
jgi:hypothetical protein